MKLTLNPMKKLSLLPYIILLLAFFAIGQAKGQIVITKWDTVSDGAGCRINAEWSDANPMNSSTFYVVNGGGTIDGQGLPLIATNLKQPKLLIDGSNSRLRGWGCFMNTYIKSQWVQIGRYDANPALCYSFGANMPVPSNYVWYGCKPMDAGIGLFPSGSVINLAWDYYTISGSYKLEYSYTGTPVTTVYPQCPAYSIPSKASSTLNVTVTTKCADGSTTSKSTSVTFPADTSTSGTSGTTTSPQKKRK
jgi:hypothetical protein